MNKVIRYKGQKTDSFLSKDPAQIYTTQKGIIFVDQSGNPIQFYSKDYLNTKFVSNSKSGAFHFCGKLNSVQQLNNLTEVQDGSVYQIGQKQFAYSNITNQWVQLGFNIDLSQYQKTVDVDNKLNNKVDKEDGKSLVSDTEIQRLKTLSNYDDQNLKNLINNKVSKDGQKQLSSNDFTNQYKQQLDTLNQYKQNIQKIIDNKANKGTKLSQYGIEDAYTKKQSDNRYLTSHQDLSEYQKSSQINNKLSNKVDKEDGKSLVSDIQIQKFSTYISKINRFELNIDDQNIITYNGQDNYQEIRALVNECKPVEIICNKKIYVLDKIKDDYLQFSHQDGNDFKMIHLDKDISNNQIIQYTFNDYYTKNEVYTKNQVYTKQQLDKKIKECETLKNILISKGIFTEQEYDNQFNK